MICPLCGSTDNELYYKLEKFNLLRCNDCGFKFLDLKSIKDYNSTIENSQETEWLINPNLPHIKRRINELIKFIPSGRSLDIGCGKGEVAINLAHHGFDSVGVDIDAKIIKHLRRSYPKVSWYSGRIEDLFIPFLKLP